MSGNLIIDDIEGLMSPDHYTVGLSKTRITDKDLIAACREVLVDNQKPGVIATKYDIRLNRLSASCKSIKTKWEEESSKMGLIIDTVALPPDVMALVKAVEHNNLEPVLEALKKTKGKK